MASTDDVIQTATAIEVRVFADASALVAAAISADGPSAGLFLAARRGEIVLYASLYALGEAERNLQRKQADAFGSYRELGSQLLVVNATDELTSEVARVIEPKDAAIVAGAVAGRADYLVTYDRRHLLSHAELIWQLYRVEAMEPRDMLNIVRGRP